ncbi:MAG: elongation factor P [Nitrospinota bacterium]|nr:elongation factor P [Nitrospinota bacterium]
MPTIDMNGIRNGKKIELDGVLYEVVSFAHTKPGKGQAFVKAKIKNLKTGQVLERTFKGGDSIKLPDFEEKEMQYLYLDDSGYHFMDTETYEQTFLSVEQVGDKAKFMQENSNVQVLIHNGELIDMELPISVELVVTHTEPGLKGDTSGSASKPATVETGAEILVPLFVNIGDKLKIDTRTGQYVERVKG